MPSDHPSLSEVTTRFRTMEMKLRVSEWKTSNKNGKFYMKLWIHRQTKLRTKVVTLKSSAKPEWEERFIFSVSENFVNGDSTIFVEIYEKHKLRRDSRVGFGKYDLKSLFEEKEEKEKVPIYDDYDDEDDEIKSVEKEENGGKEVQTRERIEVRKGGNWKASVVFEAIIWKGFIKSVGGARDFKWGGVAMEYDDFMCLRSIQKSDDGTCLCFAYQPTSHK
ncbi:hypothetical protein M5689_004751 [Euphorbia peplus]|nr:hypothetical protein M5689_004751 [Euphorbia peplus]